MFFKTAPVGISVKNPTTNIHNKHGYKKKDKVIETKYGLRPWMRIGINTGPMIVGEMRSGASTSVTAIGDTVNLASRLQSLAEPGGVLLSESTYHQVQGLVEARPAGEHEIKGKAKRQKVYHLQSIRPGAVRFDRALSRGL